MTPKHDAWVSALRKEHDRELLLALEPGGARERPIEVISAAVIEPRVANLACPHCGGTYRIHEHEREAPSLRRVDAACRVCSAARSIWFRLVPDELN
ncbi:MAG: hypothetical protein SFX73_12800 [Kofleriaceae bacterium]|nr:hypothetical protein [Kofleriaceae bacterium]